MTDFLPNFGTCAVYKVPHGICSDSVQKVSSFIMKLPILMVICSWVSNEIVDKCFSTTKKSHSSLAPGELLLL